MIETISLAGSIATGIMIVIAFVWAAGVLLRRW